MKTFIIHHTTGDAKFSEVANQERVVVGVLQAEDLDDAYTKSQNLINDWNPINPCRSTSVGDVIQDDKEFYLVCGMGFKQIHNINIPTAGIIDRAKQISEQQNVDLSTALIIAMCS